MTLDAQVMEFDGKSGACCTSKPRGRPTSWFVVFGLSRFSMCNCLRLWCGVGHSAVFFKASRKNASSNFWDPYFLDATPPCDLARILRTWVPPSGAQKSAQSSQEVIGCLAEPKTPAADPGDRTSSRGTSGPGPSPPSAAPRGLSYPTPPLAQPPSA